MIKDYIQYNTKKHPNDIFININGKDITFNEFNNQVYAIQELLKSKKTIKKLKITLSSQFNLLSSIIACNRLKIIPVIFPTKKHSLKSINYDLIAPCDYELNDFNCIIQYNKLFTSQVYTYSPEDTQCILFTSGTGLNPKAVELTFGNIYHSASSWNYIIKFSKLDNYLNILPLHHISGLSIFFRSIYFNFKSVVFKYDKKEILKWIAKYNINCTSIVPKIMHDLASNINAKKYSKILKSY